jgi:hypothetical protein
MSDHVPAEHILPSCRRCMGVPAKVETDKIAELSGTYSESFVCGGRLS